MPKKIELWEGYEVEVNEQLLDDFDFQQDLAKAQNENDLSTFISMIFAIVGGDKVFQDTREHIEQEKGYFSMDSILEILTKIGDALPKVGNRAQKRSWQTLK